MTKPEMPAVPMPRVKAHRDIPVVHHPNGRVARGYLDGTQVFHGIRFSGPAAFHGNGNLKVACSKTSARVAGLDVAGWLQFHPNGKLASGRLLADATFGDLVFVSGQYVDLDPAGVPVGGFGGEKVGRNKGSVWQSSGFFRIPVSAGEDSSHPTPSEWITDGFGCSVWPAGFCFGSHGGNPIAEWGRQVPLRDFLYGEDMDFVVQYFRNEKEAILERARSVHRTLSMVEITDFTGDGKDR